MFIPIINGKWQYMNFKITNVCFISSYTYPCRRIKAIVYTMASSGILVGAWDHLKWGHIRPIQNNNNKDADEIIDEKLIVYAEYDEEYFTFISSEAWRALKDWMNYGEISGELINNYSWVMRDYIKCSLRTFIHQQLNL
jgi:hypothetical protein